ncbi:MAG: hypothetical protein PG981_001067 [Wolbachia endosymbiont of Ctenocephalides orientis wCori]|nr:MAG: hypothetical protein PG981_001067 [Wolbachia endosymbiont of Ctenocephalides orientis wCori]
MQETYSFHLYNTEKIKPDFSLCKEQDKPFYYKLNIIPWQKLNNTIFFITEDIDKNIYNWIKSSYGIDYILIKANKDQVLNLLNLHFCVSEFASNYLSYKNPNFSAKSIRLNSMLYASFFIIVSILTLAEKYAYFALVLIFIIGCSSTLFKFITMIFSLYEKKVDYNKVSEKDLPVYTILLPAFKESPVLEQLIENIKN